MKTLHFDSTGGASGDMILGALIDLGVSTEEIQKAIDVLGIDGIMLRAEQAVESGISGTRASIELKEHEDHPHRGLQDIRKIIDASGLDPVAAERALRVFGLIAKAEGKIHGQSVDEVHFHEVGALDSIADIVGACVGLSLLGVDTVSVSELPLGQGTIECAHGTYPCPAPATLEILTGHPVHQTEEPFELVTPTGAALLMSWNAPAPRAGGQSISRIGYGLGHRKLASRPNVIRATLYEAAADALVDRCLVMECNLDDTTPELIGVLANRLMKSGARDVFTTPVQMKKWRPGTQLTVLCAADTRDILLDLIFKESTTFGVREYWTDRTVLERECVKVQTEFGEVAVKLGFWKKEVVTRAPEMSDCIRIAETAGVPVREVYEKALEGCRDHGADQ